jgi:AraC-like DNA-binding protein
MLCLLVISFQSVKAALIVESAPNRPPIMLLVAYRQRVKVEMAKKAFESSRKQVHEVMYDVGYSDIKAFREVFKSITGVTR